LPEGGSFERGREGWMTAVEAAANGSTRHVAEIERAWTGFSGRVRAPKVAVGEKKTRCRSRPHELVSGRSK